MRRRDRSSCQRRRSASVDFARSERAFIHEGVRRGVSIRNGALRRREARSLCCRMVWGTTVDCSNGNRPHPRPLPPSRERGFRGVERRLLADCEICPPLFRCRIAGVLGWRRAEFPGQFPSREFLECVGDRVARHRGIHQKRMRHSAGIFNSLCSLRTIAMVSGQRCGRWRSIGSRPACTTPRTPSTNTASAALLDER